MKGRLLGWYYALKYRAFERERRPRDGARGLIVLQIDALAHADLRRAINLGFCPTISRLIAGEGFSLRRWFSGLPSATPYAQAGIFHGENDGIPAFRFYDKAARMVITCNAPHGVQYIRDRITSPGALAGGSSYVNLLDGDAQTVAFTVATREKMSVWRRLGGKRMLLLILLHPIRMLRMVGQSVAEWLLEEWDRLRGELARQTTHSEGLFPFVRILSNVVVRELQTMAILLDVYLGVPVIYSTYMQYDELAHHFGPSSKQALSDLKRTDQRIAEIWRMVRTVRERGGRDYDFVVLSDHGMTPAVSYRVRFKETLGKTVTRILRGDAKIPGLVPLESVESNAEDTEYSDVGASVMETLALTTSEGMVGTRVGGGMRRVRDWVRSRYGLREIIMPEKYRIDRRNDVVVTYSSCLALVYFADAPEALTLADIATDSRRAMLYASLLSHAGIGLVATRSGAGVHLESRAGRAYVEQGQLSVMSGTNPLEIYGTEPVIVRAVERLVRQPNAGDLMLFGAYDGYEIVSFDDQVGAHGSAGGEQVWPFLITPPSLDVADATIEDARDIWRVVMQRGKS